MSDSRRILAAEAPAWLLLNVAALAASLAHVFIDYQIGLFGASSPIMSPLQAANILCTCLVIAWWTLSLALASTTTQGSLFSAFTLSIGWALVANGAAAIAAVPPPSAAFPYQDIAHFSSLILGGLAGYTTWNKIRTSRLSFNWRCAAVAIVLMLIAFGMQATLGLSSQ